MAANKSGLDSIVKAVLSVGNKEQNFAWSPQIITDQRNVVESLLLSALVKAYPFDKTVTDMLMPFMKTKKIRASNGYVKLPDDYRNLLGSPSISLKPDGGDCHETPSINTQSEFDEAILKSGCRTVPIEEVSQSEWDYRTTSTYAFPTKENPIFCFFGERQIRVCPYDVGTVEIRYCKKETPVRYGYITQPDDTFIFDPLASVETEFTEAAYRPIFEASLSLYTAYTRDSELRDWARIINEQGIL